MRARPLTIERKLNEPSVCQLVAEPAGQWEPRGAARNQYTGGYGDDGTTYFTGYIAVSPLAGVCRAGLEGPRYRIAIQAVSDELLLDQLLMPPSAGHPVKQPGALMTAW
jgi:hypothetical protein